MAKNKEMTFDLGENGVHSFESLEELEHWITAEQGHWGSLGSSQNGQIARRSLDNLLASVQKAVSTAKQEGHSLGDDAPAVAARMNELKNQKWVHSASSRGHFITALARRDAETGAAAMCMFLDQAVAFQNNSAVRGAVEAAVFEKRLSKESIDASETAFSALVASGNQQVTVLKKQQEELGAETNQLKAQCAAALQEIGTERETDREEHQSSYGATLEEAKQKLRVLEATYDKKLSISAPTKYWSTRRKAATKYSYWSGGFVALGLVLTAVFFAFTVDRLLIGDLEIRNFVALAIVATPVFWGLRLLTRFLLSNVHLATDAAERTIMLSTYLALCREDKFSDEQRDLILTALFRPSSTGIVRDDTSPMIWTDLMSKVKQ